MCMGGKNTSKSVWVLLIGCTGIVVWGGGGHCVSVNQSTSVRIPKTDTCVSIWLILSKRVEFSFRIFIERIEFYTLRLT